MQKYCGYHHFIIHILCNTYTHFVFCSNFQSKFYINDSYIGTNRSYYFEIILERLQGKCELFIELLLSPGSFAKNKEQRMFPGDSFAGTETKTSHLAFTVCNHIEQSKRRKPKSDCFFFCLQTVSVAVSVLTLTFISIDRWYAICFPLKFKSTTGRAKTAIGIIWLLALAFGKAI